MDRVAAVGDWLLRHQRAIQRGQWVVVGLYVTLLVVPALLPLPGRQARIWNDLVLLAQFMFWGIWWPFVLLSMVLVGRAWCGLLCPEGALSEAASRRGRGLAIPRWMRWRGWPFAAFASTTIYGQMVSVYQYPAPAVIVLGGSTLAAILVGYLYGRSKRVWCHYLCPVSGVFGLLTKLAPLHFRVDRAAWNTWTKPRGTRAAVINCAPLVPIPTMQGNSACHMCGRCSGFRGAVALSRRSPNDEIVRVAASKPEPWETVLIVFGLVGLATGAFNWTSSARLVAVKQALAERLIGLGVTWPLEPILPWWLLTNYPAQNDTLSPLDGALLVGYILVSAIVIGGAILLCLAAASRLLGRWRSARLHHLAQGLIPIAGCGVFLGLSALTVTMLRAEGVWLGFVTPLRIALLAGASLWSAVLGWQITGVHSRVWPRRLAATLLILLAIAEASWATLYWSLPARGGW
ncbi:MAG: 4Fe-4S binding protein [Hyphomicrobiaceae bacterium]|nr:MAG: 4Fe-4S binding protein [Hyphomicrobiaceae bacterium]